MNKFTFETSSGHILHGGDIILPLGLNDFEKFIMSHSIILENVGIANDVKSFHFGANINAYEFGINISYSGNELTMCWLAWDGGVAAAKGYATSEKELISDKNALSKFIAKISGKRPETTTYNHDIFIFDWGKITTSASLQSVIATIGISWFAR